MTEQLKKKHYVITELITKCIHEAENEYRITKTISDETIRTLSSVCGPVFTRAAEHLDYNLVTRYKSKNGHRCLYKIGGKNEEHSIFENVNYCNCHFYVYQVLTGRSLMCKHVLSVKLAIITNKVKEEVLTDSQFVELLNAQLSNFYDDTIK